ncbi:MAG: hypothetical protein V1661_01300 [bacterium]
MKDELIEKINVLASTAREIKKKDSDFKYTSEELRFKDFISRIKKLEGRIWLLKNSSPPLNNRDRELLDSGIEELAKLKKEIDTLPNNLKFQVGV